MVTPSHLDSLYASIPAATQSAFLQIAGADHVYYTQFLCPTLADPAGIPIHHGKFPYVPPTTTPPGDAGALRAVDAGRCLDVTGAATADGSPVELWTCNGGSNQQRSPPS
ncbi:RICIN domain-containing protein [Streptomyces mirabilis]|uniref:RICIN domain-containing protein n=1 Tax=Streptomyces mirabilis TaxID=68239 RepID=UPI003628E8E1